MIRSTRDVSFARKVSLSLHRELPLLTALRRAGQAIVLIRNASTPNLLLQAIKSSLRRFGAVMPDAEVLDLSAEVSCQHPHLHA